MNKEQIVDYVMNTPNNTNRMILEQMLDELGGNGMAEEPLVFCFNINYEDEDDGAIYDEDPTVSLSKGTIEDLCNIIKQSTVTGASLPAMMIKIVENDTYNGDQYIYWTQPVIKVNSESISINGSQFIADRRIEYSYVKFFEGKASISRTVWR